MSPSLTDKEVIDLIRREVQTIAPRLNADGLNPDAYIADIGIDSLETLELIGRLEDRTGLALPDYELANIHKVDDLVSVIQRIAAEGM
jgi:acyl carrier protein